MFGKTINYYLYYCLLLFEFSLYFSELAIGPISSIIPTSSTNGVAWPFDLVWRYHTCHVGKLWNHMAFHQYAMISTCSVLLMLACILQYKQLIIRLIAYIPFTLCILIIVIILKKKLISRFHWKYNFSLSET